MDHPACGPWPASSQPRSCSTGFEQFHLRRSAAARRSPSSPSGIKLFTGPGRTTGWPTRNNTGRNRGTSQRESQPRGGRRRTIDDDMVRPAAGRVRRSTLRPGLVRGNRHSAQPAGLLSKHPASSSEDTGLARRAAQLLGSTAVRGLERHQDWFVGGAVSNVLGFPMKGPYGYLIADRKKSCWSRPPSLAPKHQRLPVAIHPPAPRAGYGRCGLA